VIDRSALAAREPSRTGAYVAVAVSAFSWLTTLRTSRKAWKAMTPDTTRATTGSSQ